MFFSVDSPWGQTPEVTAAGTLTKPRLGKGDFICENWQNLEPYPDPFGSLGVLLLMAICSVRATL